MQRERIWFIGQLCIHIKGIWWNFYKVFFPAFPIFSHTHRGGGDIQHTTYNFFENIISTFQNQFFETFEKTCLFTLHNSIKKSTLCVFAAGRVPPSRTASTTPGCRMPTWWGCGGRPSPSPPRASKTSWLSSSEAVSRWPPSTASCCAPTRTRLPAPPHPPPPSRPLLTDSLEAGGPAVCMKAGCGAQRWGSSLDPRAGSLLLGNLQGPGLQEPELFYSFLLDHEIIHKHWKTPEMGLWLHIIRASGSFSKLWICVKPFLSEL